jgi:threonine/homoserine/homoserine lactone efflux protein
MLAYITSIVWGILIGLVSAIPVGPVGIICFQRALAKNRLSGLVTGLGSSVADALLASVGAFSITVVFTFIRHQHDSLRVVGGIFLLILGYIAFTSKPKTNKIKVNNAITRIQEFLSGFVLTITNPLTAIVFFVAFGNVSHKIGAGLDIATMFVIGIFIGANIWWSLLTLIADRVAHRIIHDNIYIINKIFAVAIILFGFFVLGSALI